MTTLYGFIYSYILKVRKYLLTIKRIFKVKMLVFVRRLGEYWNRKFVLGLVRLNHYILEAICFKDIYNPWNAIQKQQ